MKKFVMDQEPGSPWDVIPHADPEDLGMYPACMYGADTVDIDLFLKRVAEEEILGDDACSSKYKYPAYADPTFFKDFLGILLPATLWPNYR